MSLARLVADLFRVILCDAEIVVLYQNGLLYVSKLLVIG